MRDLHAISLDLGVAKGPTSQVPDRSSSSRLPPSHVNAFAQDSEYQKLSASLRKVHTASSTSYHTGKELYPAFSRST